MGEVSGFFNVDRSTFGHEFTNDVELMIVGDATSVLKGLLVDGERIRAFVERHGVVKIRVDHDGGLAEGTSVVRCPRKGGGNSSSTGIPTTTTTCS